MLNLLLDEKIFPALLIAGAVLTPLAAFFAARKRPQWRGRLLRAAAAFGPFALAFWGLHNLVLSIVGFDAAASALIALLMGLCAGIAAGEWIRRKPFDAEPYS